MARKILLAWFVSCLMPVYAHAADILYSAESWRFVGTLEPAVPDGSKYSTHHYVTAGGVEYQIQKNVFLRASLGSLTSDLRTDGTKEGGDGLYLLIGAGLEQELETGGGLILDGNLSLGLVGWSSGGLDYRYNHQRTGFLVGYAFGRHADVARIYGGVSYNTLESRFTNNGTPFDFEYKSRWALVAGVRSRSSTALSFIEVSALGEMGIRMGMAFGF